MKKSDHQLIQRVLDGSLAPRDFAAFQERLRAEPGLAKLYGEYALLSHTLHEEFEGQTWAGRESTSTVKVGSRALPWFITAALALIVAFLVFQKSVKPAVLPKPIATFTFSMDAVWHVEGAVASPEGTVSLGLGDKLHLMQGRAEISLGNSTSALLEAPAVWTAVSDSDVHLAEGRARFRRTDPGIALKVTTPKLAVTETGNEFGIESRPDQPDELHAIRGVVNGIAKLTEAPINLTEGKAVQITGLGATESIAADHHRFIRELGDFTTLITGRIVKSDWRFPYGTPLFSEEAMDGENYSAFLRMETPLPGADQPVVLVTLETATPAAGAFHTDGWAGMSFFSNGLEVLFFGDGYGVGRTWSLDVKQRIPVVVPDVPILGAKTITLSYNGKTGDVSLHEGGLPLGKPFGSAKLPPGTTFDEIRLGASAGAALAVRSLTLRVGGGR